MSVEMTKLTERQRSVLSRLGDASPDMVSFRGQAMIAAHRLEAFGLAQFVANDKWGGGIFRITDAGRAALTPTVQP